MTYFILNSCSFCTEDIKEDKRSSVTRKYEGEVGLEVNTEETKDMLMSRHQCVGQNHNLLNANNSFENVAKFKFLRTVTNQKCIHEEIRRRLYLGNACYHSLQSLVFSSPL